MDRFGAGTVTLVNDELLVLTEKGELICAPADASGFKPKARARFYHQVCVRIPRSPTESFMLEATTSSFYLELKKRP